MNVGLITSGAYVGQDLAAEFGSLPPSFLPAGNTRLYELQSRLLSSYCDEVVISLPDSYDVPEYDHARLENLNVQLIYVEDGLTLCESILAVLANHPTHKDRLILLHGDTLFLNLDLSTIHPDSFLTHTDDHPYPWAVVDSHSNEIHSANLSAIFNPDFQIVSGLFSFSSIELLADSLKKNHCDFVAALNDYSSKGHVLLPIRDEGTWLDFGHLNMYFRSRKYLTTQRAFNDLNFRDNLIQKQSTQKSKLIAEAYWYENEPWELRATTVNFLNNLTSENPPSYWMSYEYLCSLSDLYVFAELPQQVWIQILSHCKKFLDTCLKFKPPSNSIETSELFFAKTHSRLDQYAKGIEISLTREWKLNGKVTPSIEHLICRLEDLVDLDNDSLHGVMHGDFCFSNILFDFRKMEIKVLDPRGHINGEPTIYGDLRYDLAKLSHSIVGGYDFIVTNRYSLFSKGTYNLILGIPDLENRRDMITYFHEQIVSQFSNNKDEISAITILLFLSMLPLHSEDENRQKALLANALRLFLELDA